MNWESERQKIELCRSETYLMSAAAGILHPEALAASQAFLEQLHRHGDKFWELNIQALEEARQLAAELLQASPQEVCFVNSSSMAMSLAANLLKQKNYDRFMSFCEEFPTTTLPWLNAGYNARWIQSTSYEHSWEKIAKEASSKEVILLSSVESLTGYAHPMQRVREYAQERKLPLVVNATQSLGVMPLPAENIPFICASIHKWLMSGFGLSIFKVSLEYLDADLPVYGWLSQKDPWKFFEHKLDPLREAKVFELGCAPLLQILSLGAVLKWIKKVGGVPVIWERVQTLVEYTYRRSAELNISTSFSFSPEHRSAIVFFPIKDATTAEKKLGAQGIYVNARGENLRIALHWFNNEDDIDRFLLAYKKLTQQS